MTKKLTIRAKLFAAFGLVILFVLGMAALGISGIGRINDFLVRTQSEYMPKTQIVGEINDWAGRYTISLFLCGWLPHCKWRIELLTRWSGAVLCPAF